MNLIFWAFLALLSYTCSGKRLSFDEINVIYKSGVDALNRNELDVALANMRLVKKNLPQWPDVYFILASIEMKAKNPENAFELFDEAVERFPKEGSIYSKFCATIGEYVNRLVEWTTPPSNLPPLQKAVNLCVKSVELLPDDPAALQTFAATMSLLTKYDVAVQAFELWIRKFGHLNQDETKRTTSNLVMTLLRKGDSMRAYQVASDMSDSLDREGQSDYKVTSLLSYVRSIGWPMDPHAAQLKMQSLRELVATYRIYGPGLCAPNRSWRVALNYSEEADTYPDELSVTLLNRDTAYSTYGRADDPVFVNEELPKQPHFYHERFMYLIHWKKVVYMAGYSGVVHSDCTIYTGSHHINIDLQTFPETDLSAVIVDIPHRTVSIIQHQIRNYYHWLMEALPKLLLLKEYVLDFPGNEDIKILVPEIGSSEAIDQTFDIEELRGLRSRFLYYESPNTKRYRFSKGLYLIDWIHPREDQHMSLWNNLWGVYWPPRQVHLLVHDFFQRARKSLLVAKPFRDEESTVVYVSREGKTRSFPNEAELIAYLRGRFGKKLVVHTGGERLMDQVGMFSNARVVVGNHGAGLVNYVHTRPKKAALVMVPMDPHVEFCFGHMVHALDGRSYVVTAIPGSHYYGGYSAISQRQMEVLADTVERAYTEMGSAEASHDEL